MRFNSYVPFIISAYFFSDPSNAGGDSMYAMMKSVPGGNMSAVSSLRFYTLSRKTVNTRENFWNVYFFATNQMRDETATDNCQTAA